MVSSLQPCITPIEAFTNLENWAREGGQVLVTAVLRFIEIVKECLSMPPPVNVGEVVAREQELHRKIARESLDPVFSLILQGSHDSPAVKWQADIIAKRGGFTRQLAQAPVQVMLLGGSTVQLRTPYHLRRDRREKSSKAHTKRSRTKSGNGVYPILAQLGIHHRVSPALGSEMARLVAQGTQREAIANLAVRGIHLKLKVLQRVVGQIAEKALHYRQVTASFLADGPGLEGKRIAIGIDGGRLRLRENVPDESPRKSGRRGFKAEWREPKLFVVYELDARGRREKKGFIRYDATLGNANDAALLLADLLTSLGAQSAKELVFLGDGAQWIWSRFDFLQRIFSEEGAKTTQIVDFYHAAEHLQLIANEVKGWSATESLNWFKANKAILRAGKIETLIDNCKALCKGRKAKKIASLLAYFEEHADRMRYSDFESRNLPIGSGAVESGIRRVVNLRLKGNGIFWTRKVAEGLLHLRSQLLSGRWNDYLALVLDSYVRPDLRPRLP
jgi:hypothetical protein